jgi:hypothetical protein
MNYNDYMQVYCAALNGLIIAQGRNDLLKKSHEIWESRDTKDHWCSRYLANREFLQLEQIELIDGLTETAILIARSARQNMRNEF